MSRTKKKLGYRESGVDIAAADRLVDSIAKLARSTARKGVKQSIGGYASLYALNPRQWLAASTDGVGTKLKLAFALNRHDTIGIDLVAMSVNDLLCVGAEPLFFLDYLATAKLNLEQSREVIRGIVSGCKEAGCALVGGETAEMPGFYDQGEYDLAGFAVGVVSPREVLPNRTIRAGDALIGIASSGFHSNGFSLIRRLIDQSGLKSRAKKRLMLEALVPTRIYARSLLPLLRKREIKGLAHITGSGFLNVPRMSSRVSYRVALPNSNERPRAYRIIEAISAMSLAERAITFNLGIGMVVAVDRARAARVLRSLRRSGEKAWLIGEVVRKERGQPSVVTVIDGLEQATLRYDD